MSPPLCPPFVAQLAVTGSDGAGYGWQAERDELAHQLAKTTQLAQLAATIVARAEQELESMKEERTQLLKQQVRVES